MELALLVFAVTMACVAGAMVVYCAVAEAREAWDITHNGWVHGHRVHHRHAVHHS